MRIRRIAAISVLILLAALLAPLALGVAKGLLADTDRAGRMSQSYALLEAYRSHSPPEIVLASMDFDGDINDCGYRVEQLFGEGGGDLPPDGVWSPYGGYFDLFLWRGTAWREAADERRLNFLMSRTSAFSSEFLRVCLRQSLLAPLCARRVAAILEAGGMDGHNLPGPRLDQSRQTRTICTYLDGLAARRGLPLASPSARTVE